MTDPRPLLAHLGNALSRRYATPVETHPVPHVGCILCEVDARAYLRGVVEQQQASSEDARFRRFLRAYEMPAGEGRQR